MNDDVGIQIIIYVFYIYYDIMFFRNKNNNQTYRSIHYFMDSDSSIYLIIITISIIFSGYFSATETSFSTFNRIRMKNLAEKGNKKAALVLELSSRYDELISTILIGNNIVNILAASLSTLLFVSLLGQDVGATVSTAVITIVVLIFGEVSPKSIAKESPEKFAIFSAPIINVLFKLFTPFNFIFRKWKVLLSKVFKGQEEQGITNEELLTIVDEAQKDGSIEAHESTLIRSAIEFKALEAKDILTPRTDVTFISTETPLEEIQEIFQETGYSRLPVYENNVDHIVGIIHHKDFYNYIFQKEETIDSIIKPALYITKNKKIDTLLKDLQTKKMHIAVVLDEFGGTVGIVTMEDILEELVGEIWDEHDEIVHEIEEIGSNEYLVSGNTNLDKFFEHIDYDNEIDVFTVSGWVVEIIGHLPKAGEFFENEEFELEIIELFGKRIEKVRIKDKRQPKIID